MPLSTLPYLELVASFYATIFTGFGILYFLNPAKGLSFFELPYPLPSSSKTSSSTKSPTNKKPHPPLDARQTLNAFAAAYGARDIFMGLAIYATAVCGTREACGWVVGAAGAVAATDGAVCRWMVGRGEWNHWGYAPVLVLLGGVMVGGLDWVW
ncbi:MAG: hypothetical protein Q9219_006278 [cf. Caloplaca sp. 3 TL-2023]